MVLIGGLDPTEAQWVLASAFTGSADPWAQGLGVFDMTALQWKSSFNASASPYVPAAIIKQFYDNGT